MADTGEIDPTELAGEIVGRALDSEPVRNLLGPLTQNIGVILGQVSDIARFYTERNFLSIFTKWEAQRKGVPLDSDGFKRVLPLLRDAAMQSDDELQERWASLLEKRRERRKRCSSVIWPDSLTDHIGRSALPRPNLGACVGSQSLQHW
jgi:hypothetical protein